MRIAIIICLCLSCYVLYGQGDSIILAPVNNMFLQQYDIWSIAAGNDGKLWLSTNKGIVGYDGQHVQVFSEHGMFGAYRDERNNFYLVESNGIYYFNTQTGTEEFLDIELNDERPFSDPRTFKDIFVENGGSIWIARPEGFLHFEHLTKKTTQFVLPTAPGKQPAAVNQIQSDIKDKNILWLATSDGIYQFDKRTKGILRRFICKNPMDSSVSDGTISRMHVKDNEIWFVGNKSGLGCYTISTGGYSIYPYRNLNKGPVSTTFTFLQVKGNDGFYISSTDKCPGFFNLRTLTYSFDTKTEATLPALNIRHFIVDSTRNMWCVIFGQLYHGRAQQPKFVTVLLNNKVSQRDTINIFKTMIWDAGKKLFYAAFDNNDALFVLDSNRNLKASIPVHTSANKIDRSGNSHIYDICLDRYGRLWAAGTTLTVYDNRTNSMVPAHLLFKNLAFGNQHFQNIICRGNYLYLHPSNPAYTAIYRINLSTFTYDSIRVPYEIIPAGYENSWKGRSYHDVAIIDKKGKYAYIGIDNYILQVDLDTKKGRKITRVTLRDNGYFFNMFWYALDDDGNLWVTSGEGVRKIDPVTLKTEKKIHHGYEIKRYQVYNADGLGIMCLLYSEGVMLYDYRHNKEYHLSLANGLITLFNSALACVNNTLFVGSQLDALQYLPLKQIIDNDSKRNCYISDIQVFNMHYDTDTLPEFLHSLTLPHDENFITLSFSSKEFDEPEQLEYRYKLSGVDNDWVYTTYLNRTISYSSLKPGHYSFYTSIRNKDGGWGDNSINLELSIVPAWWQTFWFKIASATMGLMIILGLALWRIRAVRNQERVKGKYEKELLELEAKALRAQMNPHFIFNSLNSIKSLINKNDNEKAATYLITFSKLIRTLFQNSDKREISLYEELETCKLYAKLEKMRFGDKVNFVFEIDENIDLKDVKVPALILQPFIENAIWHGLVPKETGGSVTVSVTQPNGSIECSIDDNGIGRELSGKYKTEYEAFHQSKGIGLTRSRLELDKLINNRDDTIRIVDKSDHQGAPSGTKVILTFKEKDA